VRGAKSILEGCTSHILHFLRKQDPSGPLTFAFLGYSVTQPLSHCNFHQILFLYTVLPKYSESLIFN